MDESRLTLTEIIENRNKTIKFLEETILKLREENKTMRALISAWADEIDGWKGWSEVTHEVTLDITKDMREEAGK
jgi:hypothetical protein